MEKVFIEATCKQISAQIISYLKLAKRPLGFLINFNVSLIKEGIKRYANNY